MWTAPTPRPHPCATPGPACVRRLASSTSSKLAVDPSLTGGPGSVGWRASMCTLGCRLLVWSHHYPSHFLPSLCPEELWSREIRPFPKKSLGLVTLSGGCGLTPSRRSGAAKGNLKGGKGIIKIQKLNLRRLQRRENAVQRTPPRAHLPWADYTTYNVLKWNKMER
jgi:hypothetical protein